ncbi:probable cardiolipin synthase (CMP-forming) [Athalia rosae]|uniref:probable cardiolipin synthase (CMP-forming) n=1 Tax=Athalia rosae TaxID=37344 RepID=UPI0020340DF5|nr:probable cardiolipin synthase (CMP-forming) [Athalia rosae]XP_012255269.2 probable cardiolipin synthase (CMP-forming) [Athalia rosae]XP_020707650.2 probable cardiolipin synthase (CMP-forming) [Athalia rosae]XP_048508192.1 probable cardiolipin synthase (CMP-forming) [Athalia rosae]XP_048508193.1 probable cardiolipin synthase (CMP-forming) [Athalia rosae]XP_048508194.1 probable cardiolipin synthase (CMP-forming) [Athalia rosae]XP_048508195.1 probable cardiolipin synthase (CMP-forming) [Athal
MIQSVLLRSRYCLAIKEKCLFKGTVRLWGRRILHVDANSHNENQASAKKKSSQTPVVKVLQQRLIRDIRQTKERVEEVIEKENIWTVPNFLCISRIITSPYLGYLIVSQDYQVALCLLALAGITDLADGWIARTWSSQASKLGSLLDPVADKMLVGTLFLTLTWVELIPIQLTCLVIVRDVALVIGASYIRYRSLPNPRTLVKYFDPTYASVQLAPTFASKLNTGVQLCLVGTTLAAPVFHYVDHPLLQGLCYLTAVTTLAGGLSYLVSKDTYKFLRKPRISPPSSPP